LAISDASEAERRRDHGDLLIRRWVEPVHRGGDMLALHLRKNAALQIAAVFIHARALSGKADAEPLDGTVRMPRGRFR
jgi:hypothetical protein